MPDVMIGEFDDHLRKHAFPYGRNNRGRVPRRSTT